jgi:Ribonuclease G/E
LLTEDVKNKLEEIWQQSIEHKIQEKLTEADEKLYEEFWQKMIEYRDSLKNSISIDKSEIKTAIAEFFQEALTENAKKVKPKKSFKQILKGNK